jgi:hypothetical protein
MTRTARPLTDERLRLALVELAGQPDASLLLPEVLRSIDALPQVRRRPWDTRGWGRGVLLVAALLATLAIGAAIAFSGPRPDPQPVPSPRPGAISALEFVVPFTYVLPNPESAPLTVRGSDSPVVLYSLAGSYFPPDAQGFRRLEVFLVTGQVHRCVNPDAIEGQDTHRLNTEPSAYLEELRDRIGVGIGPISPATLGNLVAVRATVDPAANSCEGSRIHEDGLGLSWVTFEPSLDNPGTLIVGRTGDTTIGVLISASNDELLAEWLPIAQAYVDSFIFETDAVR